MEKLLCMSLNRTECYVLDLMPDAVRLAYRDGYGFKHPEVLKQYTSKQCAWYARMKELEHPDNIDEKINRFFGRGTPLFFKVRFMALHPELMELNFRTMQ